MTHFKYYLMMVFSTILFAGAFIAGKLGTSAFTPVVMTFLRIGLATVVLFPILYLKEGSVKISKQDLLISFKLGLVGMTFYHLFFFSALKYTTASNASVINASMPIITAVIASFVLKERLSYKKILFIVTAFIGVVLTIIKWDIGILLHMAFNKGDLLMICGTISWSIYGIMIKKYKTQMSTLQLMSFTLLMCMVIVTPFAIREIVLYNSLNVPFSDYYTIIYMALFPTVIGYTIQQVCIRKLGPSTTALFINLVPVFSIVLSVLLLNETVEPLMYISLGIIMLSVYLFTKVKPSKQNNI